MHSSTHRTDAQCPLVSVPSLRCCHHEGLPDDGTHGVLKHVGDLLHLLCVDYCEYLFYALRQLHNLFL
jgi:hypothetical protein